MTFEILTSDKPGNFATAKISVVPEEAKTLFSKSIAAKESSKPLSSLRATCTAGEEYAAKALIVKILNVLKRDLRHQLVCLNPEDRYPEPHRWSLTFSN